MITLINHVPGQPYPGHIVKVKKEIGNFIPGETLHVSMMKMTGRVYKPGKDFEGRFIDTVGEPDNRFMIYGGQYYATGTKEEIDEAFDEN